MPKIRAKKGRWQIFLHQRGERPGWVSFTTETVVKLIQQNSGGSAAWGELCRMWCEEITAGSYTDVLLDLRWIGTATASEFADLVRALDMMKRVTFTERPPVQSASTD